MVMLTAQLTMVAIQSRILIGTMIVKQFCTARNSILAVEHNSSHADQTYQFHVKRSAYILHGFVNKYISEFY